ncbi:MAG TPA: sigma-70 family RNA polymerase sigma factor [Planctomycetota bacterium]
MSDETSIHVVRAIAGDETSIGWLITHLRGFVEAQVRLRLRGHGSVHDVEDLAADVWVVMLQRLPDLVPREGRHAPVLMRFLGSTVLGTCNNFLRSRARLASSPAAPGPTEARGADPLDGLAKQTRTVVSRILQREQCSAVDQCLQELAPDHRDVLVLRLMEHRSNQEIGALLGVPPNTIAVRYRRALEALRSRLPPPLYAELTKAAPRGA